MTDEPATPEPQRPAMRASNADRERVAQVLHKAMSEGRITVEELEERLTIVYGAKTVAELTPVTVDLPGTSAAVTVANPTAVSGPDNRVGGAPGSASSVAILGGASRQGDWVVPTQHTSVAFWGGVDLDLRRARFATHQVTINAVAIMGSVEVVVPDDVIVKVDGVGILGAFESRDKGAVKPPPPNAPVVRVTGFAFWGAVEVIRKPRARDYRQIEE